MSIYFGWQRGQDDHYSECCDLGHDSVAEAKKCAIRPAAFRVWRTGRSDICEQ